MIAELGHLALWLALATAVALAALPLEGARRAREDWMATARPLSAVLMALVSLAFAALVACFVQSDFSVRYVASHSNLALPMAYKVSATWGGHEGSLLLWTLLLAGWTLAVARAGRTLPADLHARVLAVMGAVAAGFLLFMLATSNPFDRLWPAPADGRDLNPLLQDPGLVLHPPMLYMGYVGFAVAFAFAVAALIGGRLDAAWARFARPWTVAAWASLTVGIALGSGWAYYELGWGGWWFWDPVENASLMPWIAGTALVHSLVVTEKRGAFKAWTVLLALVAFSLSLLGTFLVRSGVLSSVHAFAVDPKRGLWILAFLAVVVGGSLSLYASRAHAVGLGARFQMLSRETTLLANNAMLAAACGAVLLGTLYPLALDALGLGKISVGPPYFEAVFVPLAMPVLLLMGVGPLVRWKDDAWPALARLLTAPAIAAAVIAAAAAWATGATTPWAVAGLAMAAWIVTTTLVDLGGRLRPRHGQGVAGRARQVPHAVWAMAVAHVGVAVFVAGAAVSGATSVERSVRLAPGDAVEAGGYRFVLTSLAPIQGPNYRALQGRIDVTRDGVPVATLAPQKRLYSTDDNPMTEADIDTGLTRDLHVALAEPVDDGKAWIVRVQVKPLLSWLWIGSALMALGGFWGAADRRYRRRTAMATATATSTTDTGKGASTPRPVTAREAAA